MHCNHCGAVLNAGAQVCTACGARVLPGPVMARTGVGATMGVATSDRVRRNIGLLAGLWMLNGILRLMEVCYFTFIGHALFPSIFAAHNWGSWGVPFRWSAWPLSMGLAWIAILFGFFGIVHLILAWGLYERKQWARPLGLVIGFLALVRFPLGTALGIYTIWVLLPEVSGREYDQIAVP